MRFALFLLLVGPNRRGRSQAIAGSARRPLEYYFGATSGGVYRSVDAGKIWEHLGLAIRTIRRSTS